MHVTASRPVDDATDPGPQTGHGAHAAWRHGAIEMRPLQARCLQPLTSAPNDDHFTMRRGIMTHLTFVEALANDIAATHQHCADLRPARFLASFHRLLQRHTHKPDILLVHHYSTFHSQRSFAIESAPVRTQASTNNEMPASNT